MKSAKNWAIASAAIFIIGMVSGVVGLYRNYNLVGSNLPIGSDGKSVVTSADKQVLAQSSWLVHIQLVCIALAVVGGLVAVYLSVKNKKASQEPINQ